MRGVHGMMMARCYPMSVDIYLLICIYTEFISFFFFNDPATTEIYTLSLHDALPICIATAATDKRRAARTFLGDRALPTGSDRKSTRLNSSHVRISYAVFCLKKKKTIHNMACLLAYDDLGIPFVFTIAICS